MLKLALKTLIFENLKYKQTFLTKFKFRDNQGNYDTVKFQLTWLKNDFYFLFIDIVNLLYNLLVQTKKLYTKNIFQ